MDGFSRSLAFIVAIDRYENGVPQLQTPVADATVLAECLRQDHDFETQLLLDTGATLSGLRTFLSRLPDQVGSEDRVLFYFAGHGIAKPSNTGPIGYILPQDAGLYSNASYLPMLELNAALSALPCRHMMIILDCCFGGALQWASTRHLALASERLYQERYKWFISDKAWQAIASASHDEEALDKAVVRPLGIRENLAGHSPFAAALIAGLKGAADRAPVGQMGDGVITATELYLHLVEALLPRSDAAFRQTPILWSLNKDDKGQFVFLVPDRNLELPPAPPLDRDANPWRSLEVYEEEHEDIFYGRRDAADSLAQRLLGRPATDGKPAVARDKVIFVTGPSGIGKSSLVRAGLLPRLKRVLGDQLVPIVIRPGLSRTTAFASLAAALKAVPGNVPSPDENALRTDENSLTAWVKGQPANRELLLVVDQAEELFTMEGGKTQDAAQAFIGRIANALDNTHRGFQVVFTVRSEFDAQFQQSVLKDRWPTARYAVPQMTQDELRRVIEGPAAVKAMRFESAELVDKLVNEVVYMPGGLPLLSFALSEMYMSYLQRRGTDRALTQADYDALKGGVVGSLQVGANQVVDDRNGTLLDTARRVLERFVSVEGGEFTRRRVPRWELDVREPAEQEHINHILNRLVEKRLVVTDEAGGQSYLEFAHDALIRGWNRLQGWVREDAERIAALRRLTFDARRWQNPGNASTLWDDPARVALIKDLQAEPSPGLNSIEHDFAVAGLRRMRRNSATRWTAIAALVILAMGALGSAFFANIQSKIASENQKAAERSARVAVSRLLASEAEAAMPDFPQRSLLLSKAAVSSTQADEATETRSVNALAVGLARVKGRPLLAARQRAASVAVSTNAKRIALATENGTVASFDLTGSPPDTLTQGDPSGSKEISLSPSGRWLVSSDHNSIAHLNDLTAKPAVSTMLTPTGAESRSALFSPDERWLFVVGVNGPSGSANAEPGEPIAQIWDLSSKAPSALEMPLTAFSANASIIYPEIDPQLITFSPAGEYFVTRRAGETTEIWFLRRPAPILVASMPASSARDLPIRFSPDGRWLLIGESPGDRSRLWYLPKDGGKPVPYSFPKDAGNQQDPAGNTTPAAVTAVAFSSDNKMVVGSADGYVRVWALSERNPLVSPVLSFKHNVSIGRLEYSPDGRWLLAKPELISDEGVTGRIFVSMDRDRRPLLFFAAAAPDFPHFDLFGNEAKDFAFSKGSDWLLVRSPGLDVWHLSEDRNLPNVMRFQTDASATVARFIGEGDAQVILTGHQNGSIQIAKLKVDAPATAPTVLLWHESPVTTLGVSYDLGWLISVAEDGSAALWRFLPDWVPFFQDGALSGVKEPVFEKGDDAINFARFSPDGAWISAKTEEGPILLGKQRADEPNQLPRLQAVGEGYFGTRSTFSDDSHWIASYGDLKLVFSGVGCPEEHTIFMKNIASQGDAQEFDLAETAFDLRFSPGGKWLLAHVQQLLASDVCPIRSAILFRTAGGLQAGAIELKGDTFMFSENGRWLAVGKGDQTELLDLQRDNPKENPILLDGKLVGPQKYTMYGKIWQQDRIVIQNEYGASVIDISGDQPADVGINLENTAERIDAADISQDGKWLVTSEFQATRVWHLPGIGGSVEAATTSATTLVPPIPSTVVFGSKKPWIATKAFDGAKIFDLSNEAEPAPIELATGGSSIATSPDECWLAASSTTGSVIALHLCGDEPWDRIVLQAGAADNSGEGAGSVAFNSASNLLSFSGNDGAIRVWDLRRQPLQQAILSDKMEGGTALVGFFPGEEGSLAILESGRLIRWSLEAGRSMDLVSRVVNRDLTPAECNRYFSQADLLLIKSAIAGCPPTAP